MGEFGEEGYKRRGVLYVGKNGSEGGAEAGLDGVGREGREEGEDEDGTADSSPSSPTPYTPILLKNPRLPERRKFDPLLPQHPHQPLHQAPNRPIYLGHHITHYSRVRELSRECGRVGMVIESLGVEAVPDAGLNEEGELEGAVEFRGLVDDEAGFLAVGLDVFDLGAG